MNRIISSIVAFFTVTVLCGQSHTGGVPKLVVGITIDQLRGDYLEMFKGNFGDKGFNRLMNGGLVYSNVDFDYPNLDRASTITTIYTGAYPAYHGITAENKFLINENREVSTFADDNYLGNFTSDKLSPLPIRVSTIADELKIASGGQSDIFAFAPHASQAMASGGHAASAAYWIEEQEGKWATTTFYKAKHAFIDQHNRGQDALPYVINSQSWRPAIDVSRYNAFPYTKNIYNFQHFFTNNKKDNVKRFKQSALVNKEVNDLAIEAITANSLGTRMNPDFLAVTFYAGNFPDALDKNYSVEIQDIYHRLDIELGRLLDAVDKAVGLDNALIFVASTGYFQEYEIIPEGVVTSGGKFYPERSQALLNMYLMALYGREQWIKRYYNDQIFFDHKLIEDRKIDLVELEENAAKFLVQSAGIQDVITTGQMLHGAYNGTAQRFRNGYYKGISGDLFLELQPGWQIVNDNSDNHSTVRNNAVVSPVIFFGNKIKPQRVYRTIDATEIAPSVSYRLRIRAPNAAKGDILQELY
ncbi:MAG: alkaline phosphatase family protein [Fermentimonas sp.]|jgi:hypothetical protein